MWTWFSGVRNANLYLTEPGRSSAHRSAGEFRDFIQSLQFNALQNPAQVEKNNQPVLQFANPRDVVHVFIRENVLRRLDFRRREPQHFGSGIHQESYQPLFQLDDYDPAFRAAFDGGFAETLAQVHYCNNLPSKIDDAFDVIGGVRDRRNFRDANNFTDQGNGQAQGLFADPQTDDLQLLV